MGVTICGRFGANITQSGETARRSADAIQFLGIRQLPHGLGVPCAKAGQHSAALPARGSAAYGKGISFRNFRFCFRPNLLDGVFCSIFGKNYKLGLTFISVWFRI